MRLISIIVIISAPSWIAYKIGHKEGLKSSLEFVQMKVDERKAREARWDANDLRASLYQAPEVEECLPVMKMFERDIVGFCSEVVFKDDATLFLGKDGREPDYRSQN